MGTLIKSVFVRMIALLLATSVAFAQDRTQFRQEELDQMLAPIALYPDALLSQILMASTYPLEVVQAARWSRSHSELQGQDAVNAVEHMEWDPSVKSLVAFPQILHMMDEKIDWTQRLGESFLAFEPQVMDTVQGLRHRAAEAGNLRSGDRMRVTRQGEDIVIEPASPQVVYVPYYDPAVAYGPWWWPGYPPVYWAPPPGYYFTPAFGPAFFWGSGIVIASGFFFGHFNWHHRNVIVVHERVVVARNTTVRDHHVSIRSKAGPVAWRHDPAHRKGVPFRHAALREQFGSSRLSGAGARQDFHRQDLAPAARRREGERSPEFRDGRSDPRRDAARNPARSVAPQSAAAAPPARFDARSSETVAGANRRLAVAPERNPRAVIRGAGDLGRASHAVTAIPGFIPMPRAAAGDVPAPRLRDGNQRGDSSKNSHGGGHRHSSMAAAMR